jgi:hypothetical protein
VEGSTNLDPTQQITATLLPNRHHAVAEVREKLNVVVEEHKQVTKEMLLKQIEDARAWLNITMLLAPRVCSYGT